VDASTTAGLSVDPRTGGRVVWLRRGFIALLAVVVVLGLAGILGVRSRTVGNTSEDGTTELRVKYAQVARAGLDVPFQISVTKPGGFDGDVTIAVSGDYLDLFDRNGVDPEPSDSTGTPDDVIWRFTRPPGDTLQVSVDMQVQGGRHWGRDGTVAVLDDAGHPVVQVKFKTWLVP
jgi:hypothetical protein